MGNEFLTLHYETNCQGKKESNNENIILTILKSIFLYFSYNSAQNDLLFVLDHQKIYFCASVLISIYVQKLFIFKI